MAPEPNPNTDIMAEKGEVSPHAVYDESGRATGESSDEKPTASPDDAVSIRRPGGLEPPEFIKGLTVEEREELERLLKRKIDMRLLPAIIVMYILNYIDRYVLRIYSWGELVGVGMGRVVGLWDVVFLVSNLLL